MIIPGYSNYDISESGVVTHLPRGRVVKHQKVCIQGYYTYLNVSIIDDTGRRRSCNVLRLMAITYLEKPEGLCIARAKDGDNTNVTLSNIVWEPYADATRKIWASGKMTNRRSRKRCTTEEFVDLLYDTMCLYDTPVTMAELSRALDVPYSTVRYAMYTLLKCGKATKLEKGFEVIL